MANYTELRGLRVKYVSSNPSPGKTGEVWYNTTDKALRAFVGRTAWSAGGNLITGRNDLAGFGIQTATACFGGVDATAVSNDTEEYNGSGWAAGEDMPSAVYEHAGTGTLTAGLSVGGTLPGGITNVTNEYDGTDWSAGGDYPAATIRLQACGTQTAALAAGGGRPTISAVVCEYNGSAWTANPSPSGDLPAAIQYHRMTGILTSAVSFGGGPSGPVTGATATYNGTTWTAQTATLNDTRSRLGGAGETDSSSVAFGGFAPNGTVNTELWDGSSWTEVSNMGTARYALAGTGTATKALGSGGYTSGRLAATEEFNNSFQVVTAGAWASGGNLPTATKSHGGGGTQTAGIASGGQVVPGSIVGETYEYDGSAWTDASADMGNSKLGRASCGTQTANLVAGGQPDTAAVEEYNGTSWSEQTDIPEARDAAAMAGIQTAAIFTGGDYPNGNNNAETFEYDGSSWSDGTDIPTAVRAHTMFGTQSAAVVCGGYTTTQVATTYEWDDSSWTTGGNMLVARYAAMGCGIQTDGLIAGGDASPLTTSTEGYDGSVWSTRPSLAAARQLGGEASSGPSSLTMGCGGDLANGSGTTATEEFTGDTAVDTASAIDFD